MKIAIIGYSGSGKSTMAKCISERFGIPVLYLDTVHWLPGWVERETDESRRIVKEFLDTHGEWVIDGNYKKLEHERRMREADHIVFMDFPRIRCFFRAWKRARRFRGKTRESITDGCEEKFDAEFRRWILKDSRTKAAVERYKCYRDRYPEKFHRVRSDRESEAFFASLLKDAPGGEEKK